MLLIIPKFEITQFVPTKKCCPFSCNILSTAKAGSFQLFLRVGLHFLPSIPFCWKVKREVPAFSRGFTPPVAYASLGASLLPHPMHLVNAWAISELRADFTPSSGISQNFLSTFVLLIHPRLKTWVFWAPIYIIYIPAKVKRILRCVMKDRATDA